MKDKLEEKGVSKQKKRYIIEIKKSDVFLEEVCEKVNYKFLRTSFRY